MDVMTLAAKLTLNTSEFDSSLKGSEKEMKGLSSGGVAWGNLVSRVVEKAGKAMLDFGKKTVQVGMDFDTQMSQVKALGQMQDENFQKVRKRAMELGESTKFTAAQVGEAFSYMALAGWDTEEMLSGIDGILNLAAASGEDLGRTSDIVTDALTAFGLEAKDTQHFVDVLAAASANSNTTVSQMGEAFKYVATMGGVMGYSIDDVAVGLGLLANNGIKSSQAGTSLRRILTSLIAPSEDAEKAMNNLGLSLFEVGTDKAKSFGQVMTELRTIFKESDFNLGGKDPEEVASELADLEERFQGIFDAIENSETGQIEAFNQNGYGDLWDMDDATAAYEAKIREITGANEEFLGALSVIGGARGIGSLIAIMKTTDKDFDQLVGSVENSEGAAQQMAETMLDNLEGDITILNSALEGLQIVVSDSFKSSLRDFVQTLTTEIGNLNEAFQANGVLGMFTNLADWVINGITDALKNAEVTGEGAASFGEAIGDFVGRTVAHLVENAPALISGLFNAGLNLAGGLIEGLFAGLFGTGEGTIPGMIRATEEEQQKAIADATKSSTEAKGILEYMDGLKEKYGEAAENTEEWAAALERLQQVYPAINDYIAEEGGNLSATNQSLIEYIENNKKRIEQEAQKKALQKYTDAYQEALQKQTEAEIQQQMSYSMADEAKQGLIDYIRGHKGKEDFTGEGLNINQLQSAAEHVANEFNESQTEIHALVDSYNKNIAAAEKSTSEINELSSTTALLKTEMENAGKALAKLASEAGSFSVGGGVGGGTPYGVWATQYYTNQAKGHATGSAYIPYDNYPALLHRGEQVLTATQARKANGGVDIGELENRIEKAIREGMATARLTAIVSADEVTNAVNTKTSNRLKGRRFAP